MTFRVASYNVRNGLAFDGFDSWPLRCRATADTIRHLRADVVGLQEVYAFQLRSILRRLPDYDSVWVGRDRDGFGGEGCPLLIRSGWGRVVATRTRWYGDTPERTGRLPEARFPRIATIGRIEVLAGGEVEVANTHLDAHHSGNRRLAAGQLVEWLDADLPSIVLGDLNAEADAKPLQVLRAAGLRDALPADCGGTNHDFTGTASGSRIDHILVSEGLEVVHAEVVRHRPRGRLGSDHWPVVADLEPRPA